MCILTFQKDRYMVVFFVFFPNHFSVSLVCGKLEGPKEHIRNF